MSSFQAVRHASSASAPSDGDLDVGSIDERLEAEMRRLAAINEELLGGIRNGSDAAISDASDGSEVAILQRENAALRARVEELEQALSAASSGDNAWLEQQKEFEALLEEKSEVIRALHAKIQDLQERGGAGAAPGEVASDAQSLHQEMEAQRRQLEEDEESLMKQMREMEMAMSKDRAELARQRSEIQRLHQELNHEIENASRDGGLRDRLVALQKLQGELTGRKQTPLPGALPKPAAAPDSEEESPVRKSLLGRIFGK